MLSIRYIFRLIQAFIIKFKAVIVISTGIGISFFLLLNFLMPNLDVTEKRIGLVGRYTTDKLPEKITTKISKGLTTTDQEGNILPSIATSWETNDEGKTWIFHLSENFKWQDDKKFTAFDINYEFSNASLSVIDERTIKFNLNNSFSAFPVIVTKPLFKKGLLGLGEYKVQKMSLLGGYVQKITLKSEKERLIYKFYPTEERLKLAFKLGEIDIAEGLQSVDEFSTWKTVVSNMEINYSSFVALFFNLNNDKFKDKAIRQGIAYSIDKEKFGEQRAISPISPFSWAYNPQVKKYTKDSSKTDDINDLNLKISVLPNLLPLAEDLATQLKDFSVDTEVEIVTDVPDNFDLFLATVDIPKDPDQYSLWHSTQEGTNFSKFNNPRIDKLLEEGRTQLDKESRKKIYIDFQRFLVEEIPAVFLYHPSYYTIIRK